MTALRSRLLAVSTVKPWPPQEGVSLRIGALLVELVKSWDVFLVSPRGGEGADSARPELAGSLSYDLPRGWTLMSSQFDVRPLFAAVEAAIDRFGPAVALLWPGAEIAALASGAFPRALVDRIDCVTLACWRDFRRARSLPDGIQAARNAWLFARYERALVRRARFTTVVGEDDARLLRHLARRDTVHVVPNGVALSAGEVKCEDPTPTVIFSGVMAYPPNAEAARWFGREVWPLVRAKVPTARFAVAGRNPSAEVRALADLPGVDILGSVPDMAAALGSAWIAVAPMRSGAGIKNKVLEAWAAATPVVMTSMAANGLSLDHIAAELVSDDPAHLAGLVVRLLGDPEERHRRGAAARELARAHSWERAGERLSGLLRQVAGL